MANFATGATAGAGTGTGQGGYYSHHGNDNYNAPYNSNFTESQNNSHQGRGLWCSVCTGPQSQTHQTFQCRIYKTPEEKRQRLWELNLCPKCARPNHHGECSYRINCRYHPGERHYTWLCDTNQYRKIYIA